MILAGTFPNPRPERAEDKATVAPDLPEGSPPDVPRPRRSENPAHQLQGSCAEDAPADLE